MKKTKKLLSLFLSVVMLASTAVFTVNAEDKKPEYGIDFIYDVDSSTATATITVSGGEFGVGHFGFAYNTEALTLLSADGGAYNSEEDLVGDVVIGETCEYYTIKTTAETNLSKDLINTENGTVLFAWYANTTEERNDFVNSEEYKKVIATVKFAGRGTPAETLDALELISTIDEAPEDLVGWDKGVYALKERDQKVDYDIEVAISEIFTADMSEINVSATASGLKLNVSWNAVDNEEEAKIKEYRVDVIDKNGTVVAVETVAAGEENLNAQNKYAVTIEDDDIVKNSNYTIKVTPITETNKLGVPGTTTVSTYAGGVSPSTPPAGGGGGGGMAYVVTFVAGDGSIAEGQKFKYYVSHNNYVTASPEVIAPNGLVFAGWSVDGVNPVDLETYKITKDVTFKALYTKKVDTHSPYINGYPGGEVRAEGLITRAETATIIARISGKYDSTKAYTSKFTDIDIDHWAYNYVSFAYENGIVIGYEDNSFAPDGYITRAEFATIIQRYFKIPINENSTFVDVGKDHWAIAYIGACKNANLVIGYENGEFRPENQITRAEAVTIINRALGRTPTAEAVDACVQEKGIPFTDLVATEWYFYDIMEAAIQHIITEFHK
ncbi:MAG: S-layer homology domain-containing protein [Clostridia bacterium]|nr:S-layer homology domain-containing protein [Clostridia bacterium]